MASTIRQKATYGGGDIHSIHPKVINVDTPTLEFDLDFNAALRLKAAVDAAVATMNRHDRATRAGRSAGLWLTFHRRSMRFTLGPTNLPAKKDAS